MSFSHRLLGPAWLVKHAVALALFAALIGLGFWQLDRLAQRRAANAERLAILEQNPVTLTGGEADPAALAGRMVRLRGVYLNDESVVLRGRSSDSGVEGVHLLTPLRLAGGEVAVLVDRGWLPAGQRSPEVLAAYAIPREVTLEGIARAPQVRPDAPLAPIDVPLPGETRIAGWVRADVAAIQRQVSAPLLPLYVEALPGPDDAPLPRPPDPRRLDEGPHLGYALQWFTFAGIIGVGYVLLMRSELRRG
jgi:surfeit locus 1 family protein